MTITNTVVTSELSSLHDGYSLTYDNSTQTWNTTEIQTNYWKLIPTANYVSTPASASTITTNVDYSHIIKAGFPIRIFNNDGYIRGAGYYTIGSLRNVSGLTLSILDEYGRIYITMANEGGGFYSITLFNNVSRSGDSIIASSIPFNSTGEQAITEYAGSGVGGTVTIDYLDSSSAIYAEMYIWQIVSSINATTITLASSTLTTGYDSILALWYGSTNKVQQLQYMIPGNYAALATTTLLADSGMYSRWQGADCRAATLSLIVNQISATPPTISFYSDGDDILDGYGAITLAGSWMDFDITNQLKTSYASNFEIGTTVGDATDDSDLTVLISMILE